MNPLANPLTSGRISNTFGLKNGFSKPKDLSSLSVPDSVMTYADALAANAQMQSQLTVPDTAPKMKVDYSTANTGISKADIDYWNMAQKKTAELIDNMSDEQKEMLAHIEDYVGKSRLKLEESIERKERRNGNNR